MCFGNIITITVCEIFRLELLLNMLVAALGRTEFSRSFIFEPPDFFADFLAGYFLLIFVGKKCPEKSSRKIPGKTLRKMSSSFLHISADWPGQNE